MDCERCGGPMMAETVIKLRRGLFGLRATQSQGAYCAACRTSVLIEGPPRRREPRPVSDRLFGPKPPERAPRWQPRSVACCTGNRCDDMPRLIPGAHGP